MRGIIHALQSFNLEPCKFILYFTLIKDQEDLGLSGYTFWSTHKNGSVNLNLTFGLLTSLLHKNCKNLHCNSR